MPFTLVFGLLGLILAALAVRLAWNSSDGWWWFARTLLESRRKR
jgi:hypothetical protein